MALNQFYRLPNGALVTYIDDKYAYEAASLLFQSWPGLISAFCPVMMAYVTSNVSCEGISCAVTAMRPSQGHQPNPNLTHLGFVDSFKKKLRPVSFGLAGSAECTSLMGIGNYQTHQRWRCSFPIQNLHH